MPDPVFKPKMPKINLKGPAIIIAIAAVAAIIFLSTSFIIVDQTENAVITTLGKYSKTLGAGLHYKLPFGLQKAYIVKTKVIQTETFGFRTIKSGVVTQYSEEKFPDESTMLTGDLNIVDVEWIIQYKIIDPQAWLFNVSDKQKTIRDISQSVINRLVGDRLILGVIGPDRQAIQDKAVVMMNEIFTKYNLGIDVTQVQLQNIVPPAGVQDAFEDVNKSIQDMNRLINEGKEAYNAEIPKAKGQADQILEIAQGYSTERVNMAKGDVARFVSVLDEYRKSPDVTRKRLYYEMMNEVFAGSTEVELIDKSFKNLVPLKILDAPKEAAK
ncbi:MAG TPA: FtsH protease activity modulator HflK [Rectinemataceae bacterium]|nr:FtsH protease activity modulator HflK [Rectinemataceae bacterium]